MEKVSRLSVSRKKALIEMSKNDVFMYDTLGEISFLDWNRGNKSFNAIQISTGTRYKCRTSFFSNTKYDVVGIHIKEEIPNDIKKLKPDDLFVIQQRRDAILLKFKEFTRSGKIKAYNPLDKSLTFTVDKSFIITLVKNIK
jgi:hypothetical protein